MANNVVTVPDAYADQLATLLAIGRQRVPVEVVPGSTLGIGWSDSLAIDNETRGQNPVLTDGDRLIFGLVADAEMRVDGGRFYLSTTAATILNQALAWNSTAFPGLYQTGTSGRTFSIAAQDGTTTGGALRLSAGAGTSNGGSVYLVPGGYGLAPGLVEVEDSLGLPLMRIGEAGVSFFGGGLARSPSVTGSRGGNAALASLLSRLDSMGLITDNTTA